MKWLAAALLLAPGLAWADPITIVATLAPFVGGTLAAAAATAAVFVSTYGGYVLAAYSVYGGIQARRKAKRQAAAARRAYNESLTDRTITTLQANPPWRVVYGRAIVGGDIVAILTSNKTGTRDNGSTYTKPDAYKHLVVVLAAHQCEAVHELYIDGIAVGALDGNGWATGGEFGGKTRTVYQERALAAGASATFDAAPTVISAGYQPAGDGDFQTTTYTVAGNTVTNTAGVSATISVKYTLTEGKVRWEKHLGLPDQAASAYLQSVVPAEWTANDRLRGLAYVVVTLDLEEARFQGGPPPLTFDVSGRVFYDERLNLFSNPEAAGAVAGTPGTSPTDWTLTVSANGVNRQIVGTGVEDGMAYVDVRVSGTPSAAGTINIRAGNTADDIPLSPGQQIQAAAYVRLVGGSMSNVGYVFVDPIARAVDGTFLDSEPVLFSPTAGALSGQRFVSPVLTAPAGSVWCNAGVGSVYVDGAGPVDITLRIGRPCVFLAGADPVSASENPAVIIRDWLTAEWGFGVPVDDIDAASVTAAANACDGAISLTVGGDTTSGARYTCNGAVTSEAAPESVLEEMAQSMAGLVTHTGGLWVVNAGAYTAPVLALTENLQAGAIEVVQAGVAYADLFNGVRGRMIERGRAVESEFDPYSNSSYVIDDAEELWTDLSLPWTDNRARARNLARIFTEQARESLVIRYPAQLHAWPLQVGDRVTVTSAEYGWSAKVFRVTDWQWSDQSAVLLTLQEDGAAIYDLADAATADQLPNTGLPNPYTVAALTGLAAASGSAHVLRQGDGSYLPRVRVTWDAISSAYVTQGGRIQIRWRRVDIDAVDQWRSLDASGNSTGEYLVGAGVGDRVIIAARAVNSLGAASDETIVTHTVAGDTTAPANATGLAYANVVGGMRVSWTEPGESDYLSTEVRQGASWAAGALLWIGSASNFIWTPPFANSYTLWVVHRDRSGNESTPVSLVTAYSVVGASSGGNSATVRLYKREDLGVAPAIPSATLTYTFATGSITAGDPAGWSIEPPASSGGKYEWVIQAQAYSSGGTDDTIAPGEWTAPQIHTRDGVDGEGTYLNDGGFEVGAGATPWALGASASLVSTSPHQGAQCLRVADTSGAAELDAATNRRFLVVPGQTLQLSVWSKRAASTPNGQLQAGLRWRDASGTIVGSSLADFLSIGLTATWANVTQPVSPPVAAVTAEFVVLTRFQSVGEWFVDSVVIQASAINGTPGTDAQTLRLAADAQVFSVSESGAGSPASITLTAVQSNLSGSPVFSVISGSATLTGSGNSRSLSFGNLATDQATVRVTWAGFTDDVTISKVYAGRSGITSVMSNATHGLPADDTGAVLSYTDSGTTIQCYEGSTMLQFNTTLAAGRFAVGTPVVSPPGAITVGARSGSGTTTCTVAAHTGVTAGGPAVIRIDYPIVLWRANGSAVSFFLTQTLSVVRRGEQGTPGADGADGAAGPAGQRGSVAASRQIAGAVWSNTEANTAISAAGYGSPQTLDLVTLYNATGTYSETRVYSAGSWITYAARVDGNLLVLGSITTDKLVANSVTAAQDLAITGSEDSFTSSVFWSGTEEALFTLTSTGAPIKLIGRFRVDFATNATTAAAVKLTCQLRRNGSTLVTDEVISNLYVSGINRRALVQVPLVHRHTPAAGSNAYAMRVYAEALDGTGNVISASGTLRGSFRLLAEENKV
jgi:hypothetical protein